MLAAVVAFFLWWTVPTEASANGHCSGDFVLDRHACEVAHHGPLIAIFGAATGLVALIGSGLLDGTRGPGSRPPPGQRSREDGPLSAGPNTLNTQSDRVQPAADVDPGPDLSDPVPADDLERMPADGSDPARVAPLDPGLPELDPVLEPALEPAPESTAERVSEVVEGPRLPQDVLDRWTILGADGSGRIVDHTGQHILTIHEDGSITDLGGNAIQSVEGDGPLTSFVDGQGRRIGYNADGVPMQTVPTEHGGHVFRPVDDLAPSVEVRPTLDAAVAARWTGAGAGLDGELYGADGAVIGRIDTEGMMRTLDGQEITSFVNEGGRLTEIGTADAPRAVAPAASETPPASTGGDEELADLVRRTQESQARQDAPTRVGQPEADTTTRVTDPETRVGDQPPATAPDTPPAGADAPPAPDRPPDTPDGPRTPEVPTPPPTPSGADAPNTEGEPARTTDAPEGPRGAGALSTALDLQGAIDQVQREVAAGRTTGEALTRATAMTWAGNAIGDGVNTNLGWGNGWDAGRVTDVRVTMLGSTMLPEGVNNLLPDQMAANTIGTGMDAIVALTEDAATSLGGGTLDTSNLDDFTRRLADRPGADPWAGYARLGELLGEELGNADGNALDAVSNLGAEAWTIREDIAVEVGESVAEFGESAAQGRHGAVLQGYAELAQAVGDPPDPAQFGRDLATMVEVAWDDAIGGGDTGGFGADFWQAQADHANQTVRGVPVVGTVYDGYAQIASGIEEQGVSGFATEMQEGASALGEEAYDYLRSWF